MNKEKKEMQMNSERYWYWLNDFMTLLEETTEKIEVEVANNYEFVDTKLSELRISERTFNNLLDSFMNKVEEEHKTIPSKFVIKITKEQTTGVFANLTKFLRKVFTSSVEIQDEASSNPINSLRVRRDNLADRISNLIESDENFTKRYEKYCENMKNPRSIGAFL